MTLTTYSDLQTAIGTWLNRTDLSSVAPDFIALAEARFERDPRVRQPVSATIAVSADNYSLPTTFKELIGLYHDGTSYFGPLRVVSLDQLAYEKAAHGDTGVPQAVAVVGSPTASVLRFGPEPNQSYSLKLIYNAAPEPLDATTVTSNWLLSEHPDIYLYGALVEAERYLQEDERLMVWEGRLQEALTELEISVNRREFSGRLNARPARSIGGDV